MIYIKIIKCQKDFWYKPLVGEIIAIDEVIWRSSSRIELHYRFLTSRQLNLVNNGGFKVGVYSWGGVNSEDFQYCVNEFELLMLRLDEEDKNNIHS